MTSDAEVKLYIDKVREMFLFRAVDKITVTVAMHKEGCTVETYNGGELIFSPENFHRKLGLVIEGSVKAYNGDSNSLINVIPEGGVFGVASMFGAPEQYCSTVVAGKHCKIIFFSESLVLQLIYEDRMIMLNYINFLSNKVRFLNKKIATYTADSAKSKLLKYLMGLVEQQSTTDGEIRLPISCQQLAEFLNMGRASLYRAFEELETDGIVSKKGKTVKIHNS